MPFGMGLMDNLNPMKPANARAAFEDRLARSPTLEVCGVVNANGASGGSNGGIDWDLIFHLAAWRGVGGPVRTDMQLRLYYAVAKADLDGWMAEIQPYAVWRVRTTVLAEPVNGQMHGRIIEMIGVEPNDADLNAAAERMQSPITFNDSQLGSLTFDRRYGWFEGEVDWCGKTASLRVDAAVGEAEPSPAGLVAARALLADASGWQRRVNAFAAARLLSPRNDAWRAEDEPEMDEEAFVARMRLESICVDADGGFDFWHDDGDLFWGHAIQISGTIARGPTSADTPG